MSQSAVLKNCYEIIFNILEKLGTESKLFLVRDAADLGKETDTPVLYMGVSDICQLVQDKNGQQIVFNEVHYDEPTRIGFVLTLTIVSKSSMALLEAVGCIIRYFKDENTISLKDEYTWHGNDDGKIYIEPVVRDTDLARAISLPLPDISLKYRIELGINSEKGTPFRRVEKRDIKSNTMGDMKK